MGETIETEADRSPRLAGLVPLNMKAMRVFILTVAGLVGTFVTVAAYCDGPLAKSCLRELNRCSHPTGPCKHDVTVGSFVVAKICFPDGSHGVLKYGVGSQQGTNDLYGPDGKLCAHADVVIGTEGTQFTYRVGGKTWILTSGRAGTTVQCPSGATEHHTDAELKQFSCGRSSTDCEKGTCP